MVGTSGRSSPRRAGLAGPGREGMLHLQRFTVSYDYPVYFGTGVFSPENPALVEALSRREPSRRHRVAVVVEARVAEAWPALAGDIEGYAVHHGARIELASAPRIEPGGEDCKNDPAAVERLAAWFDALGMDRQSFVVIVGGGALQDMVGYAAATTHRGLRVVRVPTTVLSQNDSGVGVKNGVNAFGKKNFLGCFAPPFAVLDDFSLLETLEPRDKVSGMAEAVKVALIKDPAFFGWLAASAAALARFEMGAVAELVRRCAILHLDHIAGAGDPFELGSSRPLDFGHWAAHKLESLSSYALRHGEAVAIGIALDTRYSVERGMLPAEDGDRVLALLEGIGLPTWDSRLDARGLDGRRLVLDGIREFREHLGGELTVMMLEGLGRGREVRVLDEAIIERSIDWLRTRAGASTSDRARSVLAPRDVAEAAGG
jgi:3-dehydroquinate synthase